MSQSPARNAYPSFSRIRASANGPARNGRPRPPQGLEDMPTQATAVWQLRRLMFDRGMFKTNELVGPLRDHGIRLSREQVYRLVTQPPLRPSLDVLAALCSILDCTPSDLINIEITSTPAALKRTGTSDSAPAVDLDPVHFDVS